jgi:hypothetical protein
MQIFSKSRFTSQKVDLMTFLDAVSSRVQWGFTNSQSVSTYLASPRDIRIKHGQFVSTQFRHHESSEKMWLASREILIELRRRILKEDNAEMSVRRGHLGNEMNFGYLKEAVHEAM